LSWSFLFILPPLNILVWLLYVSGCPIGNLHSTTGELHFYSDSDSNNSKGHRKGLESVYFQNSGFWKYSKEIPTWWEGSQNLEGAPKNGTMILLLLQSYLENNFMYVDVYELLNIAVSYHFDVLHRFIKVFWFQVKWKFDKIEYHCIFHSGWIMVFILTKLVSCLWMYIKY